MRAWKQTSSGRTYYIYDGDQVVGEFASGNNYLSALNTWGANGLLARHTRAGSWYYTFDMQGNVAQKLNSAGAVLSSSIFDPAGNQATNDPNPDPYSGFGGQWGYVSDYETGLTLLGHRFYDNSTQRFLTRDPISYDGGINLYAYTANNPVNKTDRLGLSVYLCQQIPLPTFHSPCGFVDPGNHIHSWLVCTQGGKTTSLGLYPTTSMWKSPGQWGGTNYPDNNDQDDMMKDPHTTCERVNLTRSQEACLCQLINHPPSPPTYSIVPGFGTQCFDEAATLIEKCTNPWFWQTGPTFKPVH